MSSGSSPAGPPRHKSNFVGYIEANRAYAPGIDTDAECAEFQAFLTKCLTRLPDEGAPADPYGYNSHMGSFVRALDQAAAEFVKAQTCFYVARAGPK